MSPLHSMERLTRPGQWSARPGPKAERLGRREVRGWSEYPTQRQEGPTEVLRGTQCLLNTRSDIFLTYSKSSVLPKNLKKSFDTRQLGTLSFHNLSFFSKFYSTRSLNVQAQRVPPTTPSLSVRVDNGGDIF